MLRTIGSNNLRHNTSRIDISFAGASINSCTSLCHCIGISNHTRSLSVSHNYSLGTCGFCIVAIGCECSSKGHLTCSFDRYHTRCVDFCNICITTCPAYSSSIYRIVIKFNSSSQCARLYTGLTSKVNGQVATNCYCRHCQILRCSYRCNRTLVRALHSLGVNGFCFCYRQLSLVVIPCLAIVAVLNGCTLGIASNLSRSREQERILSNYDFRTCNGGGDRSTPIIGGTSIRDGIVDGNCRNLNISISNRELSRRAINVYSCTACNRRIIIVQCT